MDKTQIVSTPGGYACINIPNECWVGAGCEIGPEVTAKPDCVIGKHVHITGRVRLGHNVQIGDDVTLNGPIFINDNTMIGRRSIIGVGGDSETLIGANCWIGREVTIANGVIIGYNVLIKAGVHLNGNVPNQCLVGGEPAVLLDLICICGNGLHNIGKRKWKCVSCERVYDSVQPDTTPALSHVILPNGNIGVLSNIPLMDKHWNGFLEF